MLVCILLQRLSDFKSFRDADLRDLARVVTPPPMAGIALAALCAVAWPRLRLLKDKLDELLKTASYVSADALTIDKLDGADPTAPDGDNNMVSSRAVVLLSSREMRGHRSKILNLHKMSRRRLQLFEYTWRK